MNTPEILGQAYPQADTIFDMIDPLPAVEEEVFRDKADFLKRLDALFIEYTSIMMERTHQALLGDMLIALTSSLARFDVPDIYAKMRENILDGRGDAAQEHLLTFLHELDADFKAGIERYKTGHLPENEHGAYAVVISLVKDKPGESYRIDIDQAVDYQDRAYLLAAIDAADNAGIDFNAYNFGPEYRTGQLHLYFAALIKRIYNRARKMRYLIDFCSKCSWVNLPIEEFRIGAEILALQRPGVILKYVATREIHQAGFRMHALYQLPDITSNERIIDDEYIDAEIPSDYRNEKLGLLELHAVPSDLPDPKFPYYVPDAVMEQDILHINNTSGWRICVLSGGSAVVDIPANSEGTVVAKHFQEKVTFLSIAPTQTMPVD